MYNYLAYVKTNLFSTADALISRFSAQLVAAYAKYRAFIDNGTHRKTALVLMLLLLLLVLLGSNLDSEQHIIRTYKPNYEVLILQKNPGGHMPVVPPKLWFWKPSRNSLLQGRWFFNLPYVQYTPFNHISTGVPKEKVLTYFKHLNKVVENRHFRYSLKKDVIKGTQVNFVPFHYLVQTPTYVFYYLPWTAVSAIYPVNTVRQYFLGLNITLTELLAYYTLRSKKSNSNPTQFTNALMKNAAYKGPYYADSIDVASPKGVPTSTNILVVIPREPRVEQPKLYWGRNGVKPPMVHPLEPTMTPIAFNMILSNPKTNLSVPVCDYLVKEKLSLDQKAFDKYYRHLIRVKLSRALLLLLLLVLLLLLLAEELHWFYKHQRLVGSYKRVTDALNHTLTIKPKQEVLQGI